MICCIQANRTCTGHDGMQEGAPVYDIVIGGWMNSKTVIRKQGQQRAIATAKKPSIKSADNNNNNNSKQSSNGSSSAVYSHNCIIHPGMPTDCALDHAMLQKFVAAVGEFSKYWLSLEDGVIRLGKGPEPGRQEIIRWRDPQPVKNVRYIGFRSG